MVAGGRVFVGTNNERPRNRRDTMPVPGGMREPLDKGVVMCFRASDGDILWQAVHDKLPNPHVSDWPRIGIPSTPTVVGDRVYYTSNRSEIVCADASGFADGRRGNKRVGYDDDTDADILWSYDLIAELGVMPHNGSPCSPLVADGRVFVITANGVDENHNRVKAPDAPSFVALDAKTGKLLWKDNSPGKDIHHGQWSSPAYAAKPVPQVICAGGDGWLRAFEPATGKLLWKFDGHPEAGKYELGGASARNPFVAVPVVVGDRLYVGTGDDPEHFTGSANLWCVDLTKAVEFGKTSPNRDVSAAGDTFDPAAKGNAKSAVAWHFGGPDDRTHAVRDFHFGRTMSSCCVVDDALYVAEIGGYLHCLNAKTGEKHWHYDMKSSAWGGPTYADGKVFVGCEGGELFVFRHRPKPFVLDPDDEASRATDPKSANVARKAARKKVAEAVLIRKVEFPAAIRTTPTVAGEVLYVSTENTLYAIGSGSDRR